MAEAAPELCWIVWNIGVLQTRAKEGQDNDLRVDHYRQIMDYICYVRPHYEGSRTEDFIDALERQLNKLMLSGEDFNMLYGENA